MPTRPAPKHKKTPYDYYFIEDYIMENGRSTKSWLALGKKYKRNRRNVQRWFERAEARGPEVNIDLDKAIAVKKYKHIKITRSDQDIYTDAVLKWMYHFCYTFFKWTPTPGYLRRLVKVWVFKSHVVILLPRKHGKTIALICLFAWWLIEEKKSILVITSDYHAQKRIFFALRHIIKSERVRRKYGDLLYSDNQKDWSFMFVPELQQEKGRIDPMFRCSTYKGGYVGSHPDRAHLEDVQQTVPVSKSTRERMLDDYDDNIQDICELQHISGTRKGLDDLYGAMFQRGFVPLHETAVTFHKGDFPAQKDFIFKRTEYGNQLIDTPIALRRNYLKSVDYEILDCPDFNFTKLMIRYWRNPTSFYSQMQNLPRHKTGERFKKELWIEVDPFQRGETALDRYIYTDFASGASEQSSDSCFIVSVPYNYTLWVIDIIIGKFTIDEFEDMAIRLDKQYTPLKFMFENDFAQVTSRYAPDSNLLNIAGFDTFINRGKGSKIGRINSLSSPFRFRHIKFYKTCTNIIEAKDQYLSWNETKKGFDFLDTLSSTYAGLHKYIGATSGERARVSRH